MSNGNQDGLCRDCGEPVWWRRDGGRDELVTQNGQKWCFGPDHDVLGRGMTRWHALPGMAQYVVPAPEGWVCHCLARENAHIHQIIEAAEQ